MNIFRAMRLPATAVLLGFFLLACAGDGANEFEIPPPPPQDPSPDPDPDPDPETLRTRYSFNNQCFTVLAEGSGKYLVASDSGYAATAESANDAEAFFMKPAALGEYIFYDRDRQVLVANTPANRQSIENINEAAVFIARVDGDETSYPQVPSVHDEPTPEMINAYRGFIDPDIEGDLFTLTTAAADQRLAVGDDATLTLAAPNESSAQRFRFEPANGCSEFPEANSNTEGETFSGTLPDGRLLGMADVHMHISATDFLGGAQFGMPFDRFGVTHALGDCSVEHGDFGERDIVGTALGGGTPGHETDGWPTFTDWPARDMLTHEAIYWKWMERAWMSGLRLIVNYLVENETLCKLQRNVSEQPFVDCNEMNSAAAQVGTMYALQDYIDGQYGGRGQGWFRIVLDPLEAREVIADGKLAVVLGIEISNLFDCKLTYNPLRMDEPHQETGEGLTENRYACSTSETGADSEILTQLDRLDALGIRQYVTIHEFDNAFGGNGIFDGFILNLGNRENTGGIPDLGGLGGLLAGSPEPLLDFVDNMPITEAGTGEFWTTYDCPTEIDDPRIGGGFITNSRGQEMASLGPCLFIGQGGRPGGTTPCYPQARQCNARWMTPTGLYTFKKLMERGVMLDIDHLEFEMKRQLLELAEAQPLTYPLMSSHGTFGITSYDQARRVLKGGGLLYPSLGNGPQHIVRMQEILDRWEEAEAPFLFGFGFGTDTNGLSAQPSPRSNIEPGKEVVYPYTLFSGPLFDDMPEFNDIQGVTFHQPEERDADGNGRSWHLDENGSAHYGMMSGFVQEMRLEGTAEHMRHLFNSAEVYIQAWERAVASAASIPAGGAVEPSEPILRAAPVPGSLGRFAEPAGP